MLHCFFEQSGTFKNAAKELGLDALDYDCVKTEHTDVVCDLFLEIDKAFESAPSVFDNVSEDDFCLFFFPCTYFSNMNDLIFTRNSIHPMSFNDLVMRSQNLCMFYQRLWKLVSIIRKMQLKAVIENPLSNFLSFRFIPPTYIDRDRRLHGDFFKKPTCYWFFNFTPSNMGLLFRSGEKDVAHTAPGIQRSLISPLYARNFISSHILQSVLPEFSYQLEIVFNYG